MIVCALPFLRPRDLVTSFGGQSGKDKQQTIRWSLINHSPQSGAFGALLPGVNVKHQAGS